jgi:hypothetical protein
LFPEDFSAAQPVSFFIYHRAVKMSGAKQKRKAIDLATKIEIIQKHESGEKQIKLCADYKLNKQTVSNIISQKVSLKEAYEKNFATNKRMKLRKSPLEELDEAMFIWYGQMRSKGLPIGGNIILEKAKVFADMMKLDFKASQGWLDNFKKRHGLSQKVLAGEASSVADETVNRWTKEQLPKILDGWQPNQVYNCDESGLFYKMMPNRTLATKGEEVHGSKKSKERVTLMFCANADGTDKMKMMVIGKYRNPRCFKGIDLGHLPVAYASQKNAWMDRFVYKEWIEKFDQRMTRQGKKALLLMDNVGSHKHDDVSLKSTTIQVLPPNCTSKLQPLDQGIIETCKKYYRMNLLRRVIADAEAGKETKVVLKDAIYWTAKAWENVTPTCISNCFRKAGVVFPSTEDTAITTDETTVSAETVQEHRNVWEFVSQQLDLPATAIFDDYVQCDSELPTDASDLNEREIVEYVTWDAEDIHEVEEDEAPGGEHLEPADLPPCRNASDALTKLSAIRDYCLQRGIDAFADINNIEHMVTQDNLKNLEAKQQSKITSFFEKL